MRRAAAGRVVCRLSAKARADDLAAVQVEHDGQEEPALGGFDAGHIDAPHFIQAGRWRGALGEPVGGDGAVVPALGRLRHKAPAGPRAQARGAHQAPDPALAVAVAAGTQGVREPRTPVGAAALLEGVLQLQSDPGILALAAARSAPAPAVVTAARHAQQRAQHRDAMRGGGQLLHGAVAAAHGVERMPKDFFKISRCSVTRASSLLSRRFSASHSASVRGVDAALALLRPASTQSRKVQ